MIDTPTLVDADAVTSAVIHLTIPRDRMAEHMDPAVQELVAAVLAQGAAITGPMYCHHFRRPTDTFDFELGFPVSKPVSPAGRVRPGSLPARRVARAVHRGPYEGLHASWTAFVAWLGAQPFAQAEDFVERYVVGPATEVDPAAWRTELERPLADGAVGG